MIRFKHYLKENIDMENLDREFIRRAQKITSFNLTAKDFESLKYKKEIQYLFSLHFFPKFDLTKTLTRVDADSLNNLVSNLKRESSENYKALHKFQPRGVGPGEVMLYFLIDNAQLGGGGSAGVDLLVGSKKYEVKAVSVTGAGKYANNFKVGGTFSLSDIINDTIELKKKAGLGTSSEVNAGQLETLQKKFPSEMKDIYARYQDRTYQNYFKNHEIIFIRNDTSKIGEILAVKKVKKEEIEFERITSGTIKPRVKL
jgi:hypothetical protein